MNNSPFTVMKHEIIIASYQSDRGYSFAIMVDEWHATNQDIRRIWNTYTLDDFVSYIAGLYDWNSGDMVRIVCCEDGGISSNIIKVR